MFQTSKVQAAVMAHVSECTPHSRGGGSGGREVWGEQDMVSASYGAGALLPNMSGRERC
jgi:hypothetical protein